MKRVKTGVALFVFLLAGAAAFAQPITTGPMTVELQDYSPDPPQTPTVPLSNVLANPGFETGVLSPWVNNGTWGVQSSNPQSGTFHAENLGNNNMEQFFAPVDVNDIVSISYWVLQPEAAIHGYELIYGPGDEDFFLKSPGSSWTFFDVTATLRASGSLEGIRIWGYSGGGPDADITLIDNVVVESVSQVPMASTKAVALTGILLVVALTGLLLRRRAA